MEMGVGTIGLGDSDRRPGLVLDFSINSGGIVDGGIDNDDDGRCGGDPPLVVMGGRLVVLGDLVMGCSFSDRKSVV